MHRSIVVGLGVILLAQYGCHDAQSPDAVANEVATARDKAQANVAAAETTADEHSGQAAAQVVDKAAELNKVDAQGSYDVAVATAAGEHTVAMKQCLALAGEEKTACNRKADSALELAKANAKAALAAQTNR